MSDITVPDAAVEAAARALRYNESSGMCELDRVCALCDCIDPRMSDGYARLHARKAMEAAAPHIAAQALKDMGEWFDRAAQLGTGERDVIAAQACYDRADQIEADHA